VDQIHGYTSHIENCRVLGERLNESVMPPATAPATIRIPRDRMALVIRNNIMGYGGLLLADARP
jgi:hypothetical protein